jgi:hypothetical protein
MTARINDLILHSARHYLPYRNLVQVHVRKPQHWKSYERHCCQQINSLRSDTKQHIGSAFIQHITVRFLLFSLSNIDIHRTIHNKEKHGRSANRPGQETDPCGIVQSWIEQNRQWSPQPVYVLLKCLFSIEEGLATHLSFNLASCFIIGVALASTLNLKPEQMAECWEAFSLNKNVSELTDHTFQSYRLQLIKDSEATTDLTTSVGAVQSRNVKRQATNMVTPPAAKRQQQPTVGPSSVDSVGQADVSSPRRVVKVPKYDDRTRVGEIVASFNPAGFDPIAKSTKHGQCVITQDDQNVRKPYRHMFTAMEERASALDNHLVELGNQIVTQYGIGDGENGIAPLEQVNVPGQDKICCVGRICNEVCILFLLQTCCAAIFSPDVDTCTTIQAHEGKLNSTSVLIEGSSASCGGARINVDLSSLKSSKTAYSLFPGQIVAIEGMNPTGRKLVANRICEGAAHEPSTSSIKQLQQYHYEKQDGLPVKVLTACGPFTTSDNMDYQPFVDFMHVIIEQSPDVVILTGPFVDMRQETVNTGNVTIEVDENENQTVPYEALFANKISALIEEAFSLEEEMPTTQFVLVPALEDASAQWV